MDFVVPSVPDGAYAIQYCNDPCTVSGVGDLEPSPFWIGKSALEFRIDELDSALLESRRRLTDTRRRLHSRIDHLLARTRTLAGRVETLEARDAAVGQEPARGEAVPTLAMVTATTAAVLAGSLVALRGVRPGRGRRPPGRESPR